MRDSMCLNALFYIIKMRAGMCPIAINMVL